MSNQDQAEAVTVLPVDIITKRISQGDDTGTALWRFCANQWINEEEVSPIDYFYPPEADFNAGDEEGDEDFDPDEDGFEAEAEDTSEEDAALDEQVAIEREYMDALLVFWTDMAVFRPKATTPLFNELKAAIDKMVPHMPSDLSRLCEHVVRINKIRIEAQGALANGIENRDQWLRSKLIDIEVTDRDFFNAWTAKDTGRF